MVPFCLLATLPLNGASPGQSSSTVNGRTYFYPEERPIDQKLFDAIQAIDTKKVRTLLMHGADANGNQADGWHPLLTVTGTEIQEIAIAKLLLQHGARIDYRQPDQGFTALTSALNGPANYGYIAFLLSRGARVDVPMNDGTTPLEQAVRIGPEITRLLLAHGANDLLPLETPAQPTLDIR